MNEEQERTMMANIFDMIQQQKKLPAPAPANKKKKELSEERREQLREQLKQARERKKERQNKPVENKIEPVIKEEPKKVEPVKQEPVKEEPVKQEAAQAPAIIQQQPKPTELDTPSENEIQKVYVSEPIPIPVIISRNKSELRNAYYKRYHVIY